MLFALFTGLTIKLRSTLLPYFLIVHTLADLSAVAVYRMPVGTMLRQDSC